MPVIPGFQDVLLPKCIFYNVIATILHRVYLLFHIR